MAKKVLVVDDDADFQDAVMNLLKGKGYEVVTADDGASGFKKAQKEMPDIILLDVMMAHRTEGFDIAQALKKDAKTQNIPVIVVTGICKDTNVSFKYEPDDVWLPVKAVLEKPIKPDVLLQALEKHIRI
ncbi:MAG: response regulator [Candidatus Omnitrophica bacterium]|nr:response regulator [Candidatus Omnitrophota bacterium]